MLVLPSVFAGVSTQNRHIILMKYELESVGHPPLSESLVTSDTAFEDFISNPDDLRPASRLSGAEEGPKTMFLC